MILPVSKVLLAGALMVGTAGLGGCATKKYVREQTAVVGSRVDVVETRVTAVDGVAKDALDRATAAGKLAEGKFLFTEVLSDDSMKFPVDQATLSPEAQHKAVELTRTAATEVEYWPTIDPTAVEGSREQRLAAYRAVRDQLLDRLKQRFSSLSAGDS